MSDQCKIQYESRHVLKRICLPKHDVNVVEALERDVSIAAFTRKLSSKRRRKDKYIKEKLNLVTTNNHMSLSDPHISTSTYYLDEFAMIVAQVLRNAAKQKYQNSNKHCTVH